MKRQYVLLLIAVLMVNLVGCATTDEQQGALGGAAVGAGLGALIGYAVGGGEGAAIGAAVGGVSGAVVGWSIAKARQEAVQQAAMQNQRIEVVSPDQTERVVAEPVGIEEVEEPVVQYGEETVVKKKYRKVRTRTYKKDPNTKVESMTSDTYERVPLA